MKRVPLYSRTPERTRAPSPRAPGGSPQPDPEPEASPTRRQACGHARTARVGASLRRHERLAWATLALLLAVVAGWPAWTHNERTFPTFEQIDSAMREAIAKEPLQSAAANAYEAVIGSVVRVVGEQATDRPDPKEGEEKQERRHRRGDRRQGHHPDQPARGARRRAHQGHLSPTAWCPRPR